MKIVLIRHGQTLGNLERCYIGCRTDESLCQQGIAELEGKSYPSVSRVFVSPMARCIETARLIYPHIKPEIIEDFRECDFGDFEGMSYADLSGREDYQRWVESFGALPFPGGESRAEFTERSVRAFRLLMAQKLHEDCAIIAHGGTIMAIMQAFAQPQGSYYDFQVRFGEGFLLEEDGAYQRLGD